MNSSALASAWCCPARKSRITSSIACSISMNAPSARNSAPLLSSTTTRNRFMSVDVRVGNYKLDSSNFISRSGLPRVSGFYRHGRHRPRLRFAAPGFVAGHRPGLQGGARFAVTQARVPAQPGQRPHHRRFFAGSADGASASRCMEPDWTSRNWEAEAKTVSAVLRNYPELYNSRVTYHLDLRDHVSGDHRRLGNSRQPHPRRYCGQPGLAQPTTARPCTISCHIRESSRRSACR